MYEMLNKVYDNYRLKGISDIEIVNTIAQAYSGDDIEKENSIKIKLLRRVIKNQKSSQVIAERIDKAIAWCDVVYRSRDSLLVILSKDYDFEKGFPVGSWKDKAVYLKDNSIWLLDNDNWTLLETLTQ